MPAPPQFQPPLTPTLPFALLTILSMAMTIAKTFTKFKTLAA
ncbi:hypothetical protein AB3R30_03450 [Leptolyngbyaceae cyanobacterium UHCC 1019]